jgi:hypothetical protein
MWLLTIMIWYGASGLQAFTKEVQTEAICHTLGASYHTMVDGTGWPKSTTKVEYQCVKIK